MSEIDRRALLGAAAAGTTASPARASSAYASCMRGSTTFPPISIAPTTT